MERKGKIRIDEPRKRKEKNKARKSEKLKNNKRS
jgi:hypothetical protein